MKSAEDIEILIDKYYNGETSLEEEMQLQSFFLGEVVPDHLKTYQDQFADISASSQVTWEGFSEDKLFGKLDEQFGSEEEKREETKVVKMHTTREVWFYRIAVAVALVLVGYFAGKGSGSSEIDELKEMMFAEMEGTSASGRLKAVNYSFDIPDADDEVIEVLAKVVMEERNMNVRMKGVKALTRFGDAAGVREILIGALDKEKEPAVKISLIEALVELREKGAVDNLQKIIENEDNLKEVRDEAHIGMFKLKEM